MTLWLLALSSKSSNQKVCNSWPTSLFFCRLALNILQLWYFLTSLEEWSHISRKQPPWICLGLYCRLAESFWESSHLSNIESNLLEIFISIYVFYRDDYKSINILLLLFRSGCLCLFSYLLILARTPNTILNTNVENGCLTTLLTFTTVHGDSGELQFLACTVPFSLEKPLF